MLHSIKPPNCKTYKVAMKMSGFGDIQFTVALTFESVGAILWYGVTI